MELTLKLVNGDVIKKSIDSESFIIGRSSKADVVVPHEGMSRLHCQIEIIHGEIFITDLGSTNGVLINGERIEPHKRTAYQTFWPLSFGAVQSLQMEARDFHGIRYDTTPSLQNNTRTITKTMNDPLKTTGKETRPHEKRVVSKETRIKNILINFIALGILVASAMWYLNKEELPESVPETTSPVDEMDNYDRF